MIFFGVFNHTFEKKGIVIEREEVVRFFLAFGMSFYCNIVDKIKFLILFCLPWAT